MFTLERRRRTEIFLLFSKIYLTLFPLICHVRIHQRRFDGSDNYCKPRFHFNTSSSTATFFTLLCYWVKLRSSNIFLQGKKQRFFAMASSETLSVTRLTFFLTNASICLGGQLLKRKFQEKCISCCLIWPQGTDKVTGNCEFYVKHYNETNH